MRHQASISSFVDASIPKFTPLLSFCNPTFNRAEFIGETLDSLLSQVTDEVEIVSVDGGSTDRTEEIVRGRARANELVKYVRQDRNGGVDRDMDQSVRSATGAYCWLCPATTSHAPVRCLAYWPSAAGIWTF